MIGSSSREVVEFSALALGRAARAAWCPGVREHDYAAALSRQHVGTGRSDAAVGRTAGALAGRDVCHSTANCNDKARIGSPDASCSRSLRIGNSRWSPDGDNPYLVAPGAGLEVVLHDLRIVHKVEGGSGRRLSLDRGARHSAEGAREAAPAHARGRDLDRARGSIWARVGDHQFEAPAGSYLVKPRNIPHAIWNLGPEPSLVAEIVSPAGFENYFDEIAPVLLGRGPEFNEQFYAIAERYGIVPEDAWSTELQKKYGVHL